MSAVAAIMVLASVIQPATSDDTEVCTPYLIAQNYCSYNEATGQFELTGQIQYPAPPPEPDGNGASPGPGSTPAANARPNLNDLCGSWRDPLACARASDTVPGPGISDPAADPIAADPVRAVTITDIARFTPVVGELVVEPDGWGVVGTPTNFYATAETHTMDGELFDIPIQVRWTPSSYRFDYGDGTIEETTASGSAWRGTEESWTETATSHTYATRDDVTASVTVIFTAEVNAGSGWFAVPGTLPVEAPATTVKVFEVDTVLTDGDCMANPSAAGCG